MPKKIGILNFGMGNLLSIQNALNYLEKDSFIIDNYKSIKNSDFIIIPGVGSFGVAMRNLKKKNYIEPLQEIYQKKNKILIGICLGMQLIGQSSNEIKINKGLGFAKFKTEKFPKKKNFPIPHVGFNTVKIVNKSSIFKGLENNSYFYFTHSFRVKLNKDKAHIGSSYYINDFLSVYEKENIIATQFHPEKSQINGIKMLKNILNYSC